MKVDVNIDLWTMVDEQISKDRVSYINEWLLYLAALFFQEGAIPQELFS